MFILGTVSKERLYIDHQDIGVAPLSAFGDGVRRYYILHQL